MNTHTRLMHSRIKLTKAQRNNLKIVLKSFFFQQITPHKEEHFRCKFVKTLSDSQRSGYTYYANWEAKGLSFPIGTGVWGSQTIRLNATQFKPLTQLFLHSQHPKLRQSSSSYMELDWSKVHMVENVLPLIVEAQTEANKLMEKRHVSDTRDHDFIIRMIKKYRLRSKDLSGSRYANGKKLREYHYENGHVVFNRNEMDMLYRCSDRVVIEVDSVTLPEECTYVGRYDIS